MTRHQDNNLITTIDKLDPKYFFFDLPLYENVELTTDNLEKANNILSFRGKFDAYNFIIEENTTYEGDNYDHELGNEYKYYEVDITCLRTKVQFRYYIHANNKKLIKVGQYPSLADLNIEQIKQYKNVLSLEKQKEFIRGIGLRAHGVGIGSFVYLRRVFEFLVEEEHKIAKLTNNWNEDLYEKSRMTDKIDLLKGYLPSFLVSNKDLYGILSVGVHELSEIDCLKYFDAIKMGIVEILDEKVIEDDRKKRRLHSTSELKKIRDEIK